MIELIIILILICCSGFFSGSETALTAVSRARIYHLQQEGRRGADKVLRLRENKEALIGAILLGNNLVNIAAASIATTLAISYWGAEVGPLYATILMTLIVLVFAEVLPKTVAINAPDRLSLLVSAPLSIIVKLFAPVTALVQYFIRILLTLAGFDYGRENSLISSTDAIRGTIELHHQEGGMEKEDRDMLGSILDLADREVGEVMVHRTNVYSIDMQQDPETILQQAIDSAHSRIPLYNNGNPDNISAVLHIKDVMKLMSTRRQGITREMIRRIAARPWFVPDTTSLQDQLYAFRQRRKHFACVVDEYGAFQGIVTLEDIIEEIVGDIDDEHDKLDVANIIPYGTNAYRVDGTVTIRDLNRYLDWKLPDENATTIAGLILYEAEMIPEQGAVFEFYGARFTIDERVGNQLTEIIIEPLEDNGDDSQA